MGVALVAGDEWRVGTGAFFHAFFSTVAVRLEPQGWGSRFPRVMRDLYDGEVAPAALDALRAELGQVRAELAERPPSDVVWDAEDRAALPPWGDDISPAITDLGRYFVTSEGRDLFAVLDEAIAGARRRGEALRVEGGV